MRTPLTSGDIARELGAPAPSVRYAIERANLQPIIRAGIIRLFDRSAVDLVRQELAEIRQRKTAEASAA